MMLTYEGSNPGILVSSVTPTPEALTINQHHSFVALPDSNFKPRYLILDRIQCTYFFDYTTPVSKSTKTQYVYRHRLKKKTQVLI